MIKLEKCQLIETRVVPLLSTVSNVEEGTPMVHVLEQGIAKAKPATGVAGEMYLGMAIGRQSQPSIVPNMESRTIPSGAPYTVTLGKSISGSDILVTVDGVVYSAGSPGSTATAYSLSNGVLTFNSAAAGKTVLLTYNYPISVQEAQMKYNFDSIVAGTANNSGTIGLLTTGAGFMTNFAINVDWSTVNPSAGTPVPVKLGNGVYTIGGSGTALDAYVVNVPQAGEPLLGLRFHP